MVIINAVIFCVIYEYEQLTIC